MVESNLSSEIAIIQPAEQSLISAAAVYRGIHDIVPADQLQQVYTLTGYNPAEMRRQLADVSQMASDFYAGRRIASTIDELVVPTTQINPLHRRELAVHNLQAILAQVVLTERKRVVNGQITEMGLKNKVAESINTLTYALGELGSEELAQALAELPIAERTLLYGAMSTNLKCSLEYPDVEECNPEQMTAYFHDAIYGKHGIHEDEERVKSTFSGPQMLRRVDILLAACSERADAFDIEEVFRGLMRPPYEKTTIKRIIEVAYYTNQLDILEELFSRSTTTARAARLCREYLDGEKEMEEPWWMNESRLRSKKV